AISGGDDNTIRFWDFSRPLRNRDFEPKARQAQAILKEKPGDPAALAVLGEWYAFRGVNDWAVEFLEKARAAGAAANPLTLARCCWELSGALPPQSSLRTDE